MMTLDGDFQMIYYRTDILDELAWSRRRPGTITLRSPRPRTARI